MQVDAMHGMCVESSKGMHEEMDVCMGSTVGIHGVIYVPRSIDLLPAAATWLFIAHLIGHPQQLGNMTWQG